jgi:hypothetical protein
LYTWVSQLFEKKPNYRRGYKKLFKKISQLLERIRIRYRYSHCLLKCMTVTLEVLTMQDIWGANNVKGQPKVDEHITGINLSLWHQTIEPDN